jgi:hypothetical protein
MLVSPVHGAWPRSGLRPVLQDGWWGRSSRRSPVHGGSRGEGLSRAEALTPRTPVNGAPRGIAGSPNPPSTAGLHRCAAKPREPDSPTPPGPTRLVGCRQEGRPRRTIRVCERPSYPTPPKQHGGVAVLTEVTFPLGLRYRQQHRQVAGLASGWSLRGAWQTAQVGSCKPLVVGSARFLPEELGSPRCVCSAQNRADDQGR